MSEHDTRIGSDEELFDQLRQYVDALAVRAGDEQIARHETPLEHRSSRRWSILAVAALGAVLVGSAAWVGMRDESSSIQTTSNERTTTTEVEPFEERAASDTVERADSNAIEGAASDSWLMPDPAEWVMTEAYPPRTSVGTDEAGVWAWRIDGVIYLLLEGVGLEDLGPLDEATVEAGDGRVMMGWLDGEHRLGLQGYGVDERTLRRVAATITATSSGWSIPGAEVLIAEAGGDRGPSESVQVGYSPLRADGTADLSTLVTGMHRQGTEAGMYRVLFEASSIGRVTETSVAGRSGFLMTGPFTSYGLAFGDGTISSWSTTTPDVDLSVVLASARVVDTGEWGIAVAEVDQVVEQAVEAIVTDPGSAIDASDRVDDANLPRYVLPEPWKFTFVTDMGLWSAEERAQREALGAANSPPGGFAELISTQGFTTSDSAVDPAGSLPFAVPDIVVQVHRRETDEPITSEIGVGEQFSFAGLDGYLERIDVYEPNSESESRTELRIFAAQGPLVVNIEAPFSTEDDLRRFAESLSIREGDLAQGVESKEDDIRLLMELPGDTGNGANFYSRWLAGYTTNEASDDLPEASLRVESMSFEQLQIEVMRSRTRGLTYEPVPGTNYLAARYEQLETLVIDEDGNPSFPDDPEATGRTSLLWYDPDTLTMVRLDLADNLAAAISLIEEVTEIDLDTWRELVEPHNAKPLQPR